MPTLSTTASLSGTVYFSNGRPAAGRSIIIKRVTDAHGNLISSEHTLYKTNVNGVFQVTVPQNSYVYIYADVDSFNLFKEGSPVYIGSSASYELKTITADLDFPIQVPVALVQGASNSTFLELTDTPASYVGFGTQFVSVKADESGLDFHDIDLSAYTTTGALSGYSLTSHTHDIYATTASLSGYASNATLTAYSTTGHTHSQYVTSETLTGYVALAGNQTVSGTKTFQSNVKGSSTPAASDDLTNKLYVDTQLQAVTPWVMIDSVTTTDSTPQDTALSISTDSLIYYSVIAFAKSPSDLTYYYMGRSDYLIRDRGSVNFLDAVIRIAETTSLSGVGHRLYDNSGIITSSITGDATQTLDWAVYAIIKSI